METFPKQKPFQKNYFYQLSIPYLLADITLICFSFFISDEFFSNTGVFLEIAPWKIVAMYCLVTLTLPWYLGYMFTKNEIFYEKRVMKLFKWVFILIVLMVLVNLIRFVFYLNSFEVADKFNIAGYTGVFALFLLILGPLMSLGGVASAKMEFEEKEEDIKKFKPNKLVVTGAIIIITLSIAFMLYFISLFPDASNGWGSILAFVIAPLSACIVYGIFIGILSLLDKYGLYKYFKFIAIYTFPFFIIIVLVFWSGVALHFMQQDFGDINGKLSAKAMLFSVCISGLVPYRLVMLFNAPLRIGNILLGVISLIYFFWQMSGIIK